MSKKPVLIVEDDEGIRTAMQMTAEMFGFTAFSAANGQEAFELLETMPRPGLILLDLMMPVMDGWTFAQAIEGKKDYADIPIVAVTAFTDQARAIRKVKKVLGKPVDIDVLDGILQRFCS